MPTTKKENFSPEFQDALKRTSTLNKLARSINFVITRFSFSSDHGIPIKSKDYYERLHIAFRRIISDHRYHLLQQLFDVEVNVDYLMDNLLIYTIDVTTTSKNIHVCLRSNKYLMPTKKVDCYNYEVLVMQWFDGKDDPHYDSQITDWVDIPDNKIIFHFDFPVIENCRQWVICVKGRFGKNKKNLDSNDVMAVKIEKVGSFSAEDNALEPPKIKSHQPRRSKKDPDPIVPKKTVHAERSNVDDFKKNVQPGNPDVDTKSPDNP